MALILTIETSTAICSAALVEDGKVIALKETDTGFNHASLLSVFVNDVVTEAGKELKDLDAVAVSKGPGSYTGLRIGVSTAKGLCYALDTKLISVSALDSMAIALAEKYQSEENITFAPMIDARRMEVYTAFYDNAGVQTEDIKALIIDEENLKEYIENSKLVIAGDGAEKCLELYSSENLIYDKDILPSAKYMAALAEVAFKNEKFEDVAYFEPYYLKDFVAGKPKVKGLF